MPPTDLKTSTGSVPQPTIDSPARDRAEQLAAKTGRIVDAWFRESIQNSPVSRDIDAYNHLYCSLDDLKARLAVVTEE